MEEFWSDASAKYAIMVAGFVVMTYCCSKRGIWKPTAPYDREVAETNVACFASPGSKDLTASETTTSNLKIVDENGEFASRSRKSLGLKKAFGTRRVLALLMLLLTTYTVMDIPCVKAGESDAEKAAKELDK